MSIEKADVTGQLVALNVLTSMALALAARKTDDPRGSLAEVLSAVEEQLGDSFSKMKGMLDSDHLETMSDSARTTVLAVAKMADTFLSQMGAPPAA